MAACLKLTFENHLTHQEVLTHQYKHKLRLSFGFVSPSEHDLAGTSLAKSSLSRDSS